MEKKKYTPITPKLFSAAKIMFAGGAMIKEVAEYLSIGASTAQRIRVAENYEDYKQQLAAMHARQKTGKKDEQIEMQIEDKKSDTQKPVTQSVTIQATHYMMEELRIQNELLKDISKKLAFIVEQLA